MTPFNQNNKPPYSRLGMAFPFIIICVVLAVGGVVMYLWNAILPSIAHFEPLNYWQAVGLFILCRILFGNFGGRHRGGGKPFFGSKTHEWREKWMNMSEEERIEFKEQWRKRCK